MTYDSLSRRNLQPSTAAFAPGEQTRQLSTCLVRTREKSTENVVSGNCASQGLSEIVVSFAPREAKRKNVVWKKKIGSI